MDKSWFLWFALVTIFGSWWIKTFMDNKNYVKKNPIRQSIQFIFLKYTVPTTLKKKTSYKNDSFKTNLPIYPSTHFSLDRTQKSRVVQPKPRIEKSVWPGTNRTKSRSVAVIGGYMLRILYIGRFCCLRPNWTNTKENHVVLLLSLPWPMLFDIYHQFSQIWKFPPLPTKQPHPKS